MHLEKEIIVLEKVLKLQGQLVYNASLVGCFPR